MAQTPGYYPRIGASMMSQNLNMIVSVVGKFTSPPDAQGMATFQCSDGGTLRVSFEHAEPPTTNLTGDGPVMELVGQSMSNDLLLLFVTREFSTDMDTDLYNKMINVQHSPKFQHYFLPPDTMATN